MRLLRQGQRGHQGLVEKELGHVGLLRPSGSDSETEEPRDDLCRSCGQHLALLADADPMVDSMHGCCPYGRQHREGGNNPKGSNPALVPSDARYQEVCSQPKTTLFSIQIASGTTYKCMKEVV